MDLHRRSCVLPSNAPALPESDSTIPSRVLQERSANRRHDYADGPSSWKRSSSPLENVHSGRVGGFFTGSIGSQLNGEKSDAQIEYETKRLLNLLRRCDKYQKYRDRQPQTAKDREQRWPDHLEEAFFRGLVRWPPMGRRKHMLDGQLRGRNELVADSIQRDTGEPRSRKQVSSHIQVLKNILADQGQILVYMSTEDMGGRRNRHSNSHYGHHRSRHHPSHSKYDQSQGSSSTYSGYSQLPSSAALARLQSGDDDAPYTVADFSMYVEVGKPNNKRRVHDFTQLTSNPRVSDVNFSDTTSWHKQYPEFNFHRTDEFKTRHVLVCDASIKVMTMERPAGAELSITFDLRSHVDLSIYDSLETRTRFFENGKLADQYEGDPPRKVKQTCTAAEFYAQHGGLVRVKFGSLFWVHQMQKLGAILRKAGEEEQSARVKYETIVRRELQYMTAAQDIYGIKDGETKCFLTILWRFNQTRTSHEPGRMNWRVVSFGQPRERRWMKEEELEDIKNAKALVPISSSSSGPTSMPASVSTSASSIYPSLPLDFHQPFAQHPPTLDLETFALDGMPSDFSHPNSATAPSLATDYSQTHSLPSLSHSQDTSIVQPQDYHDPGEFDFHGGHITISGCLEPAINLDAYETYNPHSQQQALSLHSITGLENDPHHTSSFDDLGLGVSMANCYATKPSWHHPSLISHLENAAEQYSDLLMQGTHAENVAGHGVLHDGQVNQGFWKLQSAFGDDTGVGADHRKDSVVRMDAAIAESRRPRGHTLGQNLMDLINREAREERYRAY